jgi:predicted nucleotidyltransferase
MAQIAIPYEALQALSEKYHIHKLSLFGSVLREDFRPDSDVDVLVEFEPETRVTLLDLAAIQRQLGHLLGRSVDLGTPGSLSPFIRDHVLETARVIFEQTNDRAEQT